MIRVHRPWMWLLGLVLWSASPVAAQQGGVEFMPRTKFFMDASHLSSDEQRFRWSANLSGEIDLLGWNHRGRATFFANYEVVLGDQLRRFDPNQGNYTLDGMVMQGLGPVDVGVVLHHISRHLSDRVKVPAIDWNQIAFRLQSDVELGRVGLAVRGEYRHTMTKSLVDYAREVEGAVNLLYAVTPRVGFTSRGLLRVVGVDGTLARGTQTAARAEGGVRLGGSTASALELFLAAERRLDPYPLEYGVGTWVTAGFRLSSR